MQENIKKIAIFSKYANYLIKYARYKNGPSKNQLYGKNWSRNNKETRNCWYLNLSNCYGNIPA